MGVKNDNTIVNSLCPSSETRDAKREDRSSPKGLRDAPTKL